MAHRPFAGRLVISAIAIALAPGCSGAGVSPAPPARAAASQSRAPDGLAAPLHVPTMAFYQGENENDDLPASFMAANYTWTEQAADGAGAAAATAFAAAGGAHALVYTDPNARNCTSNQPGTCDDIMSPQLDALGESSWLHGASGNRLYARGQQRNYPLDANFQAAWISSVKALFSAAQAWSPQQGGAVELDTMNWTTLAAYDGAWGQSVEVQSDAQVLQAQEAVAAYSPGTSVLNGVDYDYPQNYDQLLSAVGANVSGAFNEDAFATDYGSGYMTATYPVTNAWQNQEDGILDVLSHAKRDFVWMEGDPSPAHRLYGLASYWLTYAHRSVLWEDFCAPDKTPGGYCNSTWADAQVVPARPLQTATNLDIATLQTGGLYRREFASCYQAGQPIGGCAALVNPTASTVAVPPLAQVYAGAIVLPTQSLWGGGAVTWTATLPSSIGPNAAIILDGGAPSGDTGPNRRPAASPNRGPKSQVPGKYWGSQGEQVGHSEGASPRNEAQVT